MVLLPAIRIRWIAALLFIPWFGPWLIALSTLIRQTFFVADRLPLSWFLLLLPSVTFGSYLLMPIAIDPFCRALKETVR